MTRVLSKLARRGAATRGLSVLLALSLLASLVLDLSHHAAHAGHAHQARATATVMDGQLVAAERYGAVLSAPATGHQQDRHAGSAASGCDCCAATCLMLMSHDIVALAPPSPGSERMPYEPAAVLNGPPPSPERPPIATL